MPSKTPKFQFRSSTGWQKLAALRIEPNRFAQTVLDHAVQSAEEGKCPICRKFFDDCEYFQRLENE
jgi:hypothetical protein